MLSGVVHTLGGFRECNYLNITPFSPECNSTKKVQFDLTRLILDLIIGFVGPIS